MGPGGFYRLDENNKPIYMGYLSDVVCSDFDPEAFFEDLSKRSVHQTQFEDGKIKISTVFLGWDHNYSDTGPPILWETMVFGGELDQYQRRYSSHEEAVTGHWNTVKRVRATISRSWWKKLKLLLNRKSKEQKL